MSMVRRIAVLTLGSLHFVACSTGRPAVREPVEADVEGPAAVEITALVPGVWLHRSTVTIAPWGEVPAYGSLVEGAEEILLIDTAWTDPQTADILRWAESRLDKPVTAAVFTHFHSDKMGGAAALRERKIATYAAADTNRLAVAEGRIPAENVFAFDDEGGFELAGAMVFDPGPGHTEDNIVVGLPEAGVLYGGCLIRPPGATDLGNTSDADLAHWDLAVEAVVARFPELPIVVPSHGPPGGRELLGGTIRLVREHRGQRPQP